MFVARSVDGTIYGLWTVRQFPGQEELPDDAPEIVAFLSPPSIDALAAGAVDGIDRLRFEVAFDAENRIRALEGKAAVTRAQYRDALVARWKQLNGG